MRTINWQNTAAVLFCTGVFLFAIVLLWKYALPVLLPFLTAFLLSIAIRSPAKWLASHTGIPVRVWSVALFLLLLATTVALLALFTSALLREVTKLLTGLAVRDGDESAPFGGSFDFFSALTAGGAPFHTEASAARYEAFRQWFNETATRMLESALSTISSKIPEWAGKVVSFFPSVLLASVVTVVSGFYFCVDGKRIGGAILSILPHRIREGMPRLHERIRRISWRYVRAYLWLMLLTFAVLLAGFLILGLEYALLSALIVAFVDLLPVLGVGTVLIPWAVVSFAQKNTYLGVGLLILYAAVLVLRQIMEPRLLGHSLGLHPLLTLFAGYAGWQFFGIAGMALGPLLLLALRPLWRQMCRTGDGNGRDGTQTGRTDPPE